MATIITKHLSIVVALPLFIGFSLAFAAIPLPRADAPLGEKVMPRTVADNEGERHSLEQQKLVFQQRLEDEKLTLERQKIWASALAICVPLLIGVITLWFQGRQKRIDAREAFELKALEVMFSGDSPVATKNRAAALRKLYPDKFKSDFGGEFQPSQFAGPRYEAKLEVFKAACAKVETADDVYRIWASIFPADNWIRPLANAEPTVTMTSSADIEASSGDDADVQESPVDRFPTEPHVQAAAGQAEGYSNHF